MIKNSKRSENTSLLDVPCPDGGEVAQVVQVLLTRKKYKALDGNRFVSEESRELKVLNACYFLNFLNTAMNQYCDEVQ